MRKLKLIKTLFGLDDKHQEIVKGINEIINYINNQEQIAASTGNSSRITPNNGETPFKNKKKDNPVPPLDETLDNIFDIANNNRRFSFKKYMIEKYIPMLQQCD